MDQTASEIRVVIADDEPLARRGLQQLLAAHADCTIVGEARNGREAVRTLRRLQPDLLFLDVQMPGLDGFQALQALAPEQQPIIVFVTAYDEFALPAFDAQALDYLLKPVTQDRFDRSLQRVRERLRSLRAMELTHELVSLLSQQSDTVQAAVATAARPAARSIVVPTETGDLVLDPDEIDWIQALDYYAAVHALGRRHLIRESLASLESRLDATQFVRVHRSALVRLDRVRELRAPADGATTLMLRDGTAIPVSRRRRERVASLIRRR